MREPNLTGQAVDIQSHWLPDSYFRAIREEAADNPIWAAPFRGLLSAGPDAPLRRLEERLPAMDQAGIAVALLCVTPCTFRHQARAIKAASASNDDLIATAAHRPSPLSPCLCSCRKPGSAGSYPPGTGTARRWIRRLGPRFQLRTALADIPCRYTTRLLRTPGRAA